MNKNGYSTVRSWRDDVSRSLGGLEAVTKNIDKKLNYVCKEQANQGKKIGALETINSNRAAVSKKMAALYVFIIGVVAFLSNIAFKLFR